jgi:hypothetical protein
MAMMAITTSSSISVNAERDGAERVVFKQHLPRPGHDSGAVARDAPRPPTPT